MRHVVVSLAEPLPASETLESMDATLKAGRRLHAMVINRTPPAPPRPRPEVPPGWAARLDALEHRTEMAAGADRTLAEGLASRGLGGLPRWALPDAADADARPPWATWSAALTPLVDALEAP
jgi:hypothetical protein